MENARETMLVDPEKSRAANRKKARTSFFSVLLLTVLWCGLVYGGFYYSKQYLDQAVQKVQQTNAMNVQQINERLSALSADLKGLESIIGETGQTISSAGNIQQELKERIELLDEQIKELKHSLNVLKEAPNAAN